jgi:CheY-like chemotaxis protein
MFSQQEIWDGIEQLARRKGCSLSRFSILAGLDPTALNRSKRFGPDLKPRWPSTETLSKLLTASQTTLTQFCEILSAGKPDNLAPLFEILLVDDDVAFREMSALTLRQAGYSVYAAADDGDALGVIEHGRSLDLLCTDIVMPEGLGGVALSRLARMRHPALKVLYISGYDIPGIAVDATTVILRKPLGKDELLNEVGHLLGAIRACGHEASIPLALDGRRG